MEIELTKSYKGMEDKCQIFKQKHYRFFAIRKIFQKKVKRTNYNFNA